MKLGDVSFVLGNIHGGSHPHKNQQRRSAFQGVAVYERAQDVEFEKRNPCIKGDERAACFHRNGLVMAQPKCR